MCKCPWCESDQMHTFKYMLREAPGMLANPDKQTWEVAICLSRKSCTESKVVEHYSGDFTHTEKIGPFRLKIQRRGHRMWAVSVWRSRRHTDTAGNALDIITFRDFVNGEDARVHFYTLRREFATKLAGEALDAPD